MFVFSIFFYLQQRRKDKEVHQLLSTLENISEIRDFEINRFVNNCKRLLPEVNTRLATALDLCEKIPAVETGMKNGEK